MEKGKAYFAFISYSRLDEEWANWLTHELEHYHLPLTTNGRKKMPKTLRPIFRDIEELSAGNLPQQIHEALESSKHLIVICSPNSAKSHWVNKEIEEFIKMGRTDRIFPFIIDGIALSGNEDTECFPPALRALPKEEERLGANVHEKKNEGKEFRTCKDCPIKKDENVVKKQGDINDKGRDAAVVKIVAGMLGLSFDILWRRYEREKAEEERMVKKQRDNLQRLQSRFIAEKAIDLTNKGNYDLAKKLLLEVLPKDLIYPNRPYTIEAETALRYACEHSTAKIILYTNGAKYASISPDGKYIISVSEKNIYDIWDVETGCKKMQLKRSKDLFTSITYCEGKESSVLTYRDKSEHIWDNYTESFLAEIAKRTYYENTAFYCNEGKYIVSVSENTVVIWDSKTGKELFMFEKSTKQLKYNTVLSPDGKYIASYDSYHIVRITDISTKREYKALKGHKSNINSIVFSDDGNYLITTSDDNTIRLWETKKEEPPQKIKSGSCINMANFSPDGKHIIAASNESINIYDTETGKLIMTLTGHKHCVKSATFSPDGKRIVSAAPSDVIIVWSAETGKELFRIKERAYKVNSVQFSPDGRWIVSATGEEDADDIFKISFDYSIIIWDAETGKLLKELRGHSYIVNSAVFSPNGEIIASASSDKTVRVWDVCSGCLLKVLKGHTDEVQSIVFIPNGTKIISGSTDNTIRIWDVTTGKELLKIDCLAKRYPFINCSPDGKWIISASDGVQIWDIESGHKVWTIKIKDGCKYVSMSSDGKQILAVSSNSTIVIIKLPSLQDLIDANRLCYKNFSLSYEERQKYYLNDYE